MMRFTSFQTCSTEDTLASTDLSHYLDYRSCQTTDRQTAAAIERLDPGGLGPQSACGQVPVRGLLAAAERRREDRQPV